MPDELNNEVAEHRSELPFDQTLERDSLAIRGAGMCIFALVDHAAGSREVGLEMLPATLLIYGHPKAGTPIMQARPQVTPRRAGLGKPSTKRNRPGECGCRSNKASGWDG